MNFLAHQFLSFQNRELQIGNLFGEIVRGKDYIYYTPEIQKGILLHRSIDSYTDAHEIVKKSTKLFHLRYKKFAPVIVDVLYDYFLIKNWERYHSTPFDDFVDSCYSLFRAEFINFPLQLQHIVHHMLQNDWFHKYSSFDGIQQTLSGISKRSKFENNMEEAVNELIVYEQQLDDDFKLFFPQLIEHCKKFIATK